MFTQHVAYGIDLGTTYSVLARLGVTGAPEIISDVELGKDTLASAIYHKEDGTFDVGDSAKEAGVANPARLHQFFKRWIGRNSDPNREHYMVDGKEYDPVELSAIVIGRIIEYGKASGEDVKDVIITCPAYFDYAQREATRQAGIAAGLNVLAVINEPTAAAINFCYNRFSEDQTILVYDLGGGTFDVTLLRMSQSGETKNVDVLGTDGDAMLGGKDWDEELYELLLDLYVEKFGGSKDEIPEDLKNLIRAEVEGLKFRLSTRENVRARIPYNGENIVLEVTREKFEEVTAKFVDQTIGWMDSVISKAGITDADIDVVLMVGGSTKMPMIKNMLINRFGEKAFFGDPDKSVAKGAAIVADMMQKKQDVDMLQKLQEQLEKGNIRLMKDDGGEIKIEITNPGSTGILPGDTFGEDVEKKLNEVFKGEVEGPGGEITSTDIGKVIDIANDKPAPDLKITDVAPRTFGVVVGSRNENGEIVPVVDNIVRKDEKTPCSYTRTYYTPKDDARSLSFPVFESISESDFDPMKFDENTRKFYCSDSSLDMKERKQMVLNIPISLPMDSEILVDFSLDDLGNVHMKAVEPKSGAEVELNFSFSDMDPETLKKIAEDQKKRVYAIEA